ncbi:MAG TPA: hypothetical protein VKA21_12930, partial [Candidatus Binatia bacterium]|nr:hypothetical protein [Candidatus Binatia bacterium]
RARIALKHVLRTPREVAAFLDLLARARRRGLVPRPKANLLRADGRRLLKGTRALKADLRRLQREARRGRHGRGPAAG